ncbi:MAG: DNA topoisomerase III [Verrucomicrobiia bacterium]
MGKELVIAEKPSVAADLAKALGGFKRVDDYFESDDRIICSAIGHIVELCLPGELDKKRGKWSMANLPIIPDAFDLKPVEKTKARLNLLKRLMKRPDVDALVNACDAGREGELIFRYLVRYLGVKKPVRRLWLQSMTTAAIREAFARLRPGEELDALADAAVCRSESDWLVGINATRAMTAFNSVGGGFQLTPVGRVQTPTLAILVEREEKIRAFKPRSYWEVHATFQSARGTYIGKWFDAAFVKTDAEEQKAERLWDVERARAIAARCLAQPGKVREERKPGTQAPPLLYDLTSLQRDGNSRYGFSAARTLQLAQRLYERHKALSYPRTDSRYLPEDYPQAVKQTLKALGATPSGEFASHVLAEGWVRPNKRVFNDAKVSDHFAIIPTGQIPTNLDEAEAKLFDLVVKRFIAVFYPPARFETTVRITTVRAELFRSDGKVILDPGWMAVYGRETSADDDEKALCAVEDGETVQTTETDVRENVTKPPARYTEATLLSAMESAGKRVEDEELRDAMSERGLGTPATRAAIIDGLLKDGYLNRQGRELIATSKGISLINLLGSMEIAALRSPELTGQWEFKLHKMENGEFDRAMFMKEIQSFTREIVEKARGFEGGTVSGNYEDLQAPCPKCKAASLRETYKTFECATCGYRIFKLIAGRELERDEVATLLREGQVGPLENFRSRLGRAFSAVIKLGEEGKPEFDFGKDEPPGDPQPDEAIAKHPCAATEDGTLYEYETFFFGRLKNAEAGAIPVRINKLILQRPIPADQAVKVLETGRTDLLPKFISKKGRPFSAYLKLNGGKLEFEFEERKASTKAGKSERTENPGKQDNLTAKSTSKRRLPPSKSGRATAKRSPSARSKVR